MSNTFEIKSKLDDSAGNQLVIDVAAKNEGASVDASERNGSNNQFWEAVADPKHPGYFFIQSLQHDSDGKPVVIDIQGVSKASEMADGTKLDAYESKSGFNENQLWTIALDPNTKPNISTPSVGQQDYIFIQSYLKNAAGTPYVVDILGWVSGTKLPGGGTRLDAYHQKTSDTQNQLWRLEAQTGKFSPKITSLASGFQILGKNPGSGAYAVVTGAGFQAGATLALVGTYVDNNGNLTQGSPILTATDFAGNFTVSSAFSNWALTEDMPGNFFVSVFYNDSGIFAPPPAAALSAFWDGVSFTG